MAEHVIDKISYNGDTYILQDSDAIPAPSSASSGNVLTYNGSAWVASAPSGTTIYISDTAPTGVPT